MPRAPILLALCLLLAAPVTAAPVKTEEEKAAMSLYKKGRARFDAKDWAGAEDYFAKSMAVYETAYARLYRAAALSRLSRCGDALGILDRFSPDEVAAKARDKAREMAVQVRDRCQVPPPSAKAPEAAPATAAAPAKAVEAKAPVEVAAAPVKAAVAEPAVASVGTPAIATATAPLVPLEAPAAPRAEAARNLSPNARPIVVSPDGKGDYLRIEDALARAAPGATLHLAAGLHRLSRPLEIKTAVRMVGEGRGATVIVGDGEGFVLRFEGPGPFVLQDLAVEHQGARWARVVSVAGGEVDIRGVKVSGGVRNAAQRSGGEGLLLEGDTTGTVASSEFGPNGLHGIKLAGRARPLLEGNACRGNAQVGIAWFDDAGGTARGNTTAGNGRYGLSVVDRARPKLESNACQGDRRGGLFLEGNLAVAGDNRCERYVPEQR